MAPTPNKSLTFARFDSIFLPQSAPKMKWSFPAASISTNRKPLAASCNWGPKRSTSRLIAICLPPLRTNAPQPAAAEDKRKPSSRRAEAPAKPATEPAPVELPFRNFDVALDLRRLYLREITIDNWLVHAKLDGGKVNLAPFDLGLNGAPIKASATLNLGVSG